MTLIEAMVWNPQHFSWVLFNDMSDSLCLIHWVSVSEAEDCTFYNQLWKNKRWYKRIAQHLPCSKVQVTESTFSVGKCWGPCCSGLEVHLFIFEVYRMDYVFSNRYLLINFTHYFLDVWSGNIVYHVEVWRWGK